MAFGTSEAARIRIAVSVQRFFTKVKHVSNEIRLALVQMNKPGERSLCNCLVALCISTVHPIAQFIFFTLVSLERQLFLLIDQLLVSCRRHGLHNIVIFFSS